MSSYEIDVAAVTVSVSTFTAIYKWIRREIAVMAIIDERTGWAYLQLLSQIAISLRCIHNVTYGLLNIPQKFCQTPVEVSRAA